MKIKTTLALAVLVGCGVVLHFQGIDWPWGTKATPRTPAGTREALEKITPDAIEYLAIRRPGQEATVFTRTASGWTTNDNWPGSVADIQPVIELLGSLSSRFLPEGTEDATSTKTAMTVDVSLRGGAKHELKLSELADPSYRFVRATFLRLDDKPEVLRLAPGIVGELSRPADQYRLRRLFPSERTSRLSNPQERIERLDARELLLKQEGNTPIRLVKGAEGWEIREPSRDRLDPDTGEKLLTAVADLWVEQFVPIDPSAIVAAMIPGSTISSLSSLVCLSSKAALQRAGLEASKQSIEVTRHDGTVTTIHLGNRSRGDRPSPPARPGAPPPVVDSWRYARLDGSEVLFEVQDTRLNDIFVTFDTLRDNRLARFSSEDAEEIELRQGGQKMKLVREKRDSWKMLTPRETLADNDKVKDLLQKLSALEASEKDLLSPSKKAALFVGSVSALAQPTFATLALATGLLDPGAALGLQRPATEVIVRIREKARSDDRDRSKERTLTLNVGKPGWGNNRVYLQAAGWPRIDAMDDSLSSLLDNPTFAYRGKQLFDFKSSDVARLEIRSVAIPQLRAAIGAVAGIATAANDRTVHVVLDRVGDEWGLTKPLTTGADANKVNELLDALGRAKVLTHVADDVAAPAMQKQYGLDVPMTEVKVTFTDAAKPARTLLVGAGNHARLGEARDVFTLTGDLRDRLEQGALAYLPSALWQLAANDDIVRFKIAKAGQDEYQLVKKGDGWEVMGPFTVAAPAEVVERLATALQAPRAEEYRAFATQDVAAYGLATPSVTVTVTTKMGKEHTLALGSTSTGKPGRYARLGTTGSVFVVNDMLAKAADQSALDFLDRNVLTFDPIAVTSLQRQRDKDLLEIVKQDDAWKLTKPNEQPADEIKVPDLFKQLSALRADRILAYKPKDLKPFGLEAPFATVTIKLGGEKPTERVLLLGREEGAGGRVAMLKDSPAVAVLAAPVVRQLLAGPIAFRNHDLARIPDADTMKLEAGERKITFARPEGTWKVTQPITTDADHDALEGYFNALSRLRAEELIAEKPNAEQMKTFGLEKPTARWQILNGDETKLDLLIGAMGPGGKKRYARLADKDVVFLLDERVSSLVTTEYRPRALWKENVDPAQLEVVKFGYKTDPFELKKLDGEWKVVDKPDAKIQSTTVSDTLSALRDLKLERYVKDDAAQLKLYELDPPLLTLEATSPTGKVVLHIGGLEGGSKRRYARLPGSKYKDVFVLDEATSVKLYRDVPALMKPTLPEEKKADF